MKWVTGKETLRTALTALIAGLLLVGWLLGVSPAHAQGVPAVIYGYVYMPDGSPAEGASVTATCDSDSGSTTTRSDGYYQITLSIEGTQSVRVSASKDGLTAVKYVNVNEGTGSIRVDLTLKSESGGGGGGGGWTGGGVSYVRILGVTARETAIGDQVEIRLKVLNEGDKAAGNMQVLIYLEDWTLLETVDVGTTIPAGSEKTIKVRFDSELLGEGTHHLILVLVSSQGSAKAEVDVSVVSKAVLELYLVAPQRVEPGRDVWVNGTVRNAGKVTARGVKVRVTLAGRTAASAYLGDLPPGRSVDFSLLVKVPEDVTGTVRLEVIVTGRPNLEVREVRALTAASAAGASVACAAFDASEGWDALTWARSAVDLASNLTGTEEGFDRLADLEELLEQAAQAAQAGNCSGAQAILESVLGEAGKVAEEAMSRSAQWIAGEADRLGSLGDPRASAFSEAIRSLLVAYEASESPEVRLNLLLSAAKLISAANSALAPGGEQTETPPPQTAEPEVGESSRAHPLAIIAVSAAAGAALGMLAAKRR
ncbi:MAG: CARDB domain-containing protein [Candidatus Korarchaeota archaeon]|nr:CARDB domain-containing protein [Candidatus Korarchaeota archaeon]